MNGYKKTVEIKRISIDSKLIYLVKYMLAGNLYREYLTEFPRKAIDQAENWLNGRKILYYEGNKLHESDIHL